MGVSNFDILKANGIYAPQVMNTTGKVYFVNNATTGLPEGAIGGSNGNSGLSPLEPFSTVDYAIGRCTDSRGDVIYVMPGHSESASTAAFWDIDVIGVSIIGLGIGNNRPALIVSGTDDTTDIDFDAASCRVANIRFDFTANDSITAPIDVNAANCRIDHCEIIGSDAGGQVDDLIKLDAGADFFEFDNNYVDCTTVGCGAGLDFDATAPTDVYIHDNQIIGDFSDAPIHGTSTPTNLRIRNNYIRNVTTGQFAVEFTAAATGIIADNYLVTDAVATALDPGSCFNFNNQWIDSDVADTRGVQLPQAAGSIPDTSDNILGADSSNNDFASTNVAANEDGSIIERLEQIGEAVNKGAGTSIGAAKSLVDAVGYDGVTVVASTAGMLRTGIGTKFVVTKVLTSSAIVTGGVDVTGTASGAILIEDISFATGATGLAAGTNFEIRADNASGAALQFSETVANLGANVSESLGTGSVTAGDSFVLETGKKLTALCTAMDCTGAGTITVYITCVRTTEGGSLAAA